MPIYDPEFQQKKPEPRAQEPDLPPWLMAEPWPCDVPLSPFTAGESPGGAAGNLRALIETTPYSAPRTLPGGPPPLGRPPRVRAFVSVDVGDTLNMSESSSSLGWKVTGYALGDIAREIRRIAEELDTIGSARGER